MRVVVGRHRELGLMYAGVCPEVRFTQPGLRPSRLGATLAPFVSEQAATAALTAAGATIGDEADGQG